VIPPTPNGYGKPRLFWDDHCANCMAALPEQTTGLFCTGLCRQIARTVRYWRRTQRDQRLERDDVRAAVALKLAHVLGGGYDSDARRLPRATRSEVWERDEGLCRSCGALGVEIDHIDGDSPALTNLQLLCEDCHDVKTHERMRPTSAGEQAAIALLERERVTPDVPVLLCDDQEEWENVERQLRAARRQRLLDELEESGYDLNDFRGATRVEMLDAISDDDDLSALGLDDDSGFGEDSYFAHVMAKDD
jgi:hypothetical protein